MQPIDVKAIDWSKCDPKFHGGLQRWLSDGIYPESFLKAVLENLLMSAVFAADEDSLAGLRPLILFLYNEVPAGNWWGSAEACAVWHEGKLEDSLCG